MATLAVIVLYTATQLLVPQHEAMAGALAAMNIAVLFSRAPTFNQAEAWYWKNLNRALTGNDNITVPVVSDNVAVPVVSLNNTLNDTLETSYSARNLTTTITNRIPDAPTIFPTASSFFNLTTPAWSSNLPTLPNLSKAPTSWVTNDFLHHLSLFGDYFSTLKNPITWLLASITIVPLLLLSVHKFYIQGHPRTHKTFRNAVGTFYALIVAYLAYFDAPWLILRSHLSALYNSATATWLQLQLTRLHFGQNYHDWFFSWFHWIQQTDEFIYDRALIATILGTVLSSIWIADAITSRACNCAVRHRRHPNPLFLRLSSLSWPALHLAQVATNLVIFYRSQYVQDFVVSYVLQVVIYICCWVYIYLRPLGRWVQQLYADLKFGLYRAVRKSCESFQALYNTLGHIKLWLALYASIAAVVTLVKAYGNPWSNINWAPVSGIWQQTRDVFVEAFDLKTIGIGVAIFILGELYEGAQWLWRLALRYVRWTALGIWTSLQHMWKTINVAGAHTIDVFMQRASYVCRAVINGIQAAIVWIMTGFDAGRNFGHILMFGIFPTVGKVLEWFLVGSTMVYMALHFVDVIGQLIPSPKQALQHGLRTLAIHEHISTATLLTVVPIITYKIVLRVWPQHKARSALVGITSFATTLAVFSVLNLCGFEFALDYLFAAVIFSIAWLRQTWNDFWIQREADVNEDLTIDTPSPTAGPLDGQWDPFQEEFEAAEQVRAVLDRQSEVNDATGSESQGLPEEVEINAGADIQQQSEPDSEADITAGSGNPCSTKELGTNAVAGFEQQPEIGVRTTPERQCSLNPIESEAAAVIESESDPEPKTIGEKSHNSSTSSKRQAAKEKYVSERRERLTQTKARNARRQGRAGQLSPSTTSVPETSRRTAQTVFENRYPTTETSIPSKTILSQIDSPQSFRSQKYETVVMTETEPHEVLQPTSAPPRIKSEVSTFTEPHITETLPESTAIAPGVLAATSTSASTIVTSLPTVDPRDTEAMVMDEPESREVVQVDPLSSSLILDDGRLPPEVPMTSLQNAANQSVEYGNMVWEGRPVEDCEMGDALPDEEEKTLGKVTSSHDRMELSNEAPTRGPHIGAANSTETETMAYDELPDAPCDPSNDIQSQLPSEATASHNTNSSSIQLPPGDHIRQHPTIPSKIHRLPELHSAPSNLPASQHLDMLQYSQPNPMGASKLADPLLPVGKNKIQPPVAAPRDSVKLVGYESSDEGNDVQQNQQGTLMNVKNGGDYTSAPINQHHVNLLDENYADDDDDEEKLGATSQIGGEHASVARTDLNNSDPGASYSPICDDDVNSDGLSSINEDELNAMGVENNITLQNEEIRRTISANDDANRNTEGENSHQSAQRNTTRQILQPKSRLHRQSKSASSPTISSQPPIFPNEGTTTHLASEEADQDPRLPWNGSGYYTDRSGTRYEVNESDDGTYDMYFFNDEGQEVRFDADRKPIDAFSRQPYFG
ncbi:Nn.00g079550.m01.CDS01 [Neocucurbitaria sp. VM-36]